VNTVNADISNTGGITIAKEVLQSDDTIPVGETAGGDPTPGYLAVIYTIDGEISLNAYATFTLEGAVFAEDPWFAVDKGAAANLDPEWGKNTGGSGNSSVKYRLATEGDGKIGDTANPPESAKLYLLYKIKNVTADEVKMSVKLETTEGAVSLGSGSVTVVKLSSALTTAKITSEKKGDIFVSVADDNKLLTDNADNASPDPNEAGTEDAFRDTLTARIGYLELGTTDDIYEPDGVTPFSLGTVGTSGEINETESELVIAGGQFDASELGPGKVRLVRIDTGAESASVVAVDGKATFAVTNSLMAEIVEAGKVAIEFVVDTKNPINVNVEQAPKATLTLKFKDNGIQLDEDVALKLVDQDLRLIRQNGTVCWAYNVPYETIQDQFNIRITNNSVIPGKFTVKLYEPGGNVIADSVELTGVDGLVTEKAAGEGDNDTDKKYLPSGHTLHLNSEKLQAGIGDLSWSGRAVVKFTTELPKVEMLALLRNKLMDEASQPLNNLSLGAHGESCVQGQ
jgi:hypothetical protein